MQPYLHCEDLIKIYPQKTKVKKPTLRGLHLTINRGEFISVLGPSGCGKTTLLMIVAGLLEPSAGHVSINGHIINEFSSKDKLGYYQKEIGLLLQNPRDNVIWNLTTYDNILLPMAQTSKFVSSEDREERISWLLKQFNLMEKAHRGPKVLSGGELQRLGLMVCLANDPELILLDEPTSQLDTTNAMSIMSYLRHLCTKQGKTVLMVTHDLRIVRKTDHCFVMKEGTLQELPINYLPTGVGLTYA